MIERPKCLLDVLERVKFGDVVAWEIRLPTGASSGLFRSREDALRLAKEHYPNIPEETGQPHPG